MVEKRLDPTRFNELPGDHRRHGVVAFCHRHSHGHLAVPSQAERVVSGPRPAFPNRHDGQNGRCKGGGERCSVTRNESPARSNAHRRSRAPTAPDACGVGGRAVTR